VGMATIPGGGVVVQGNAGGRLGHGSAEKGGSVAVSYNAQTLPLSFLLLLPDPQHWANKAENCVFFELFFACWK